MLSATSIELSQQYNNKKYRILYIPTGEFCAECRGVYLARTRHYLRLLDSSFNAPHGRPDFINTKRICEIHIANMCNEEYATVEEFELVEVLEKPC